MNLKQSEHILDSAGKAITGKAVLSGKDWRTIAAIVLIACVGMASIIITAGWIGAKDQLRSLKDMDGKNIEAVATVKTEVSARFDIDEKKIRLLEDAVLESKTNFKWIRSFMERSMPKKDPPPLPMEDSVGNPATNKSLTNSYSDVSSPAQSESGRSVPAASGEKPQ